MSTFFIKGQYESKGRPPKWMPKWLARMFYWTKTGSFWQSAEVDEDAALVLFNTPIGPVDAAYHAGFVTLDIGSYPIMAWPLDLPETKFSFEPLPGQRIWGTFGLT